MASTYIDFEIQENIFSTDEGKKIFDEKSRIQRWLTIESTLAEAQAELGIIPLEAAQEIKKMSMLDMLDLEKIKAEYKRSRNSLMPVVKVLSQQCENGYGEYVHYGVTTQDIIDTAQILEIKEVLNIVYRDSRKIENNLLMITEKYCSVPMIGRTHGQHALPITFGLKASIWLVELRRHIERIKSLVTRILVGQLSGPVGTFAAMEEKSQMVSDRTLKKLGLLCSPIAWHTARDNICELSTVFAMLTATMAKIANEVFQLSKTEILELRESPISKKAIDSSAMPHKLNPVLSQRIIVIARHVRVLSNVIMESMIHEGERDPRALWSEWLSIPQLCIYTVASLDNMLGLMSGLQVHPDQMKLNLYRFKEYVSSEYLMIKLSKHIGKIQAQEKLHELMQRAHEGDISFREILLADDAIGKFFDADDLYILDNPEKYTGQSEVIVRAALAEIHSYRASDPEKLTI